MEGGQWQAVAGRQWQAVAGSQWQAAEVRACTCAERCTTCALGAGLVVLCAVASVVAGAALKGARDRQAC